MKRIVLITAAGLTVYQGSAARLAVAATFAADAEGHEAFARFLRSGSRAPLRVLVDVAEESFRHQTMPWAFGRDRRALGQRLLARNFRLERCRRVTVQGRESCGRRDLRVLLSAISSSAPVESWIDVIGAERVPLAGICSLPLLGGRLLPYLGAAHPYVLLVSQQSAVAIRQSFYADGELRLSRLIAIRGNQTCGFARLVEREVLNARRFLESQRLLGAQQHLSVQLLAAAVHTSELRQQLRDDETVSYQVTEPYSLAPNLGGRVESMRFADTLFVRLLAKQRRAVNHYATTRMRVHHWHRFARFGLHALSATLVATTVAWAGAGVIQGRLYQAQGRDAALEGQRYQHRNAEITRDLARYRVSAATVKHSVELVEQLDRDIGATPLRLMSVLADALSAHPAVLVRELQWLASHDPESEPRQGMPASHTPGGAVYQSALVHGWVTGTGRDYRSAIETMQRLVSMLRAMPGVERAELRRTPYDIDPGARSTGDRGLHARPDGEPRAHYTLVLRLSPDGGD